MKNQRTCLAKSFLSTAILTLFVLLSREGFSQCVRIDPNYPVTLPCDSKPGFNLIFADECNVFNSSTWDISSPGDDWPGYGHPELCTYLGVQGAPMNESNVSAAGGTYNLRVREGEDEDQCDYSGAEIKTFDASADPSLVRDWKITENSYVEVRYRMPSCDGIGANFWLYGQAAGRFYEIDIHEQDASDPDEIHSNIHYGPDYDHETAHPVKTKFCNLNGNSISLENKYLTFGVETSEDGVSMYLNGVFFRHHPFTNNPYNLYAPLNLRLGVGSSTGDGEVKDCNDLPQFLNIDYVRVYQKNNTTAAKILTKTPLSLCADNSCIQDYCNFLNVTHLPGAIYQWQSTPFFTISNISNNTADLEVFRFMVNPGTPSGTYSINLTVSFPCGYVEILPLTVKVSGGVPAAPNDIVLYTDDSYTFYLGALIVQNSNSYEWSIDGGLFQEELNLPYWHVNILNEKFYASTQPQQKQVCVRAKNACGVSPTYCQTVVIPTPNAPCDGCFWALLAPKEIITELMPNSTQYRLKVEKSQFSKSYEWSFDANKWFEINNQNDQEYNYLEHIEMVSDSFMMYVRAKNMDTLSAIYSQMILLDIPTTDSYTGEMPNSEVAISVPAVSIDDFNNQHKLVKYIYYNCLGQTIQHGECEEDEQPEIEIDRFFNDGLYILVKLNYDGTINNTSKLMKIK